MQEIFTEPSQVGTTFHHREQIRRLAILILVRLFFLGLSFRWRVLVSGLEALSLLRRFSVDFVYFPFLFRGAVDFGGRFLRGFSSWRGFLAVNDRSFDNFTVDVFLVV